MTSFFCCVSWVESFNEFDLRCSLNVVAHFEHFQLIVCYKLPLLAVVCEHRVLRLMRPLETIAAVPQFNINAPCARSQWPFDAGKIQPRVSTAMLVYSAAQISFRRMCAQLRVENIKANDRISSTPNHYTCYSPVFLGRSGCICMNLICALRVISICFNFIQLICIQYLIM